MQNLHLDIDLTSRMFDSEPEWPKDLWDLVLDDIRLSWEDTHSLHNLIITCRDSQHSEYDRREYRSILENLRGVTGIRKVVIHAEGLEDFTRELEADMMRSS